MKRISNRKTLTIVAQFPTASHSPSCFHAFISYTYLFCVKRSNSKGFLIHKRAWDIGLKLQVGFRTWSSLCTKSKDKMADNFSSVVHFNHWKGLRQQPRASVIRKTSLVLTINMHGRLENQSNVEISANLGLQKLALKSFCTTFSPVTPPPPSSVDFWKADVKYN